MVFTVALRLLLPVAAICAFLSSSPCKCLLPWGAVVSQVRESIQPNPSSSSPGVAFHSHPVALAVEQLFAHSFLSRMRKALFAQGQCCWVGSPLTSPHACCQAAFWKLSTPYFGPSHSFLCAHTRPRNVALLTNKVSVTNYPTVQESKVLCFVHFLFPFSWRSWSSLGVTSTES